MNGAKGKTRCELCGARFWAMKLEHHMAHSPRHAAAVLERQLHAEGWMPLMGEVAAELHAAGASLRLEPTVFRESSDRAEMAYWGRRWHGLLAFWLTRHSSTSVSLGRRFLDVTRQVSMRLEELVERGEADPSFADHIEAVMRLGDTDLEGV